MERRTASSLAFAVALGSMALIGAQPGHASTNTLDQRICRDQAGLDPDTITFTGPKSTLWPPNHKMIDGYAVTAAEEEGGANVVMLTEMITELDASATIGAGGPQHEPDYTGSPQAVNGSGSATASGLAFRAERSGTGGGRTYRIDWTASFDNGTHSCMSTDTGQSPFYVTVPHDQGKG
ncbi:MAG: hypothetical protein QOI47_1020 [Actinomycetota bacterium]|nr:hypothetical protein [Actinomycetota bacterium]